MTHLEFISRAKKLGIDINVRKRTVYQAVERLASRGNTRAYQLILDYNNSLNNSNNE